MSATNPWLKAAVVLGTLAVLGIGYLVYRASQPTVEDALREAATLEEARVAVRVELATLSTAQENFRGQHGHYAASLDSVLPWHKSLDVKLEILHADRNTWTARGIHPQWGIECVADDQTRFASGHFWAKCRSTGGQAP